MKYRDRIGVSGNELAAISSRLMQAVAWFMCARVLLRMRGGEEYGAFSIVLSLAFWLQMCDLGITSFLRTEFPRLKATGMGHVLPGLLRRGLLSILWICFLVCGALVAQWYLFPGATNFLIGVTNLESVLGPADILSLIIVLSVYSCVVISANLVQAYLSAESRQYQYYLVAALGFVFQPLAVWWSADSGHSLVAIIAVFCFSGVAPLVLQVLWVSVQGHGFPASRAAKEVRLLNRTSMSFLFIQVAGALTSNADLLLVSALFGLTEAATYSVLKLVVQLPISVHAQFNLQSWPTYVRLIGAGDMEGLRKEFKRTLIVVLGASALLAAFLWPLGPVLVRFWSSETLVASHVLTFLFCVYGSFYMLSNAFNVLMYSFGHTRTTFHLAWVGPPLLILAALALRRIGPESVILSAVFAYGLCVIVGTVFYRRWVDKQRLERRH